MRCDSSLSVIDRFNRGVKEFRCGDSEDAASRSYVDDREFLG
jgi:hypothetical protein